MVNPAILQRQSAPGQHTGTIHFRGELAYIENGGQCDWTLLQFDSPFTGVVDAAIAETTASRLRSSYKESDPVSFHGVLSDQSFGAYPFCVLFVC
jgi:hypothetical protein